MITRRTFFAAGAAGISTAHLFGDEFADRKIKVGLIGTGWYGKIDLLRLIQVAPVEVVSLCDPDQKMLADAAQIVAQRQKSKKTPRTYADYRKMLGEKDLDLVLIGSPDHWHALHAIAAMESGADLYLQKPISADISEGEAILAAARKLGRVVQVGMQRRSTPHLIEAKDRVISQGLLGKVGHIDLYCYYHMRNNDNAPDIKPPENLDYDLWTGPAPMRPFNRIVHPRGWRAFMEYGNGIVGDMCVHMLDMVRWMLDLGWPKTVSSNGGILIQKQGRANISDTQSALFDFGGLTFAAKLDVALLANLLGGFTRRLEPLTRVKLVGILRHEFAHCGGHGQTNVGVDVDFAHTKLNGLLNFFHGHAVGFFHVATKFANNGQQVLRHTGRAVHHQVRVGNALVNGLNAIDGQDIAGGLAREFVGAMAGTDGNGQGIELGALDEIGGLLGVG